MLQESSKSIMQSFPMNHWIIKTEPSTYCWDTFVKEKKTFWNGVRNYQACNNLAAMKKGDAVLFYHSGDERRIMGTAKVIKEAYPDHTADDPRWLMVDIEVGKAFKNPVELSIIKQIPELKNMKLVRQGRLSVGPITQNEFEVLVKMGGLGEEKKHV
jgi:predicted RNA-binding protein with PUA-like domain